MNELTYPWDVVARLQNQLAQHKKVDQHSRALEAVLDHILASAAPLTQEELDRIAASHRRRGRHRAILESINLHDLEPISSETEAMEYRVNLSIVQDKMPRQDWAILASLAQGNEYKDVSSLFGSNPAQLRTRVTRMRTKLRAEFPEI